MQVSKKKSPVSGIKKEKDNEVEDDILIKQEESSLTEFTRRPIPTDRQVEEFDDIIEEEEHDEEVERSLNEIYQDEDGKMVDVQKIKILKKHGIFFWLFSFILTVGFLGGIGYGLYYYIFRNNGSSDSAVKFTIAGQTEVVAGEEYVYTLKYENGIDVGIRNLQVSVTYPTNFVISDISPQPSEGKNSVWEIPFLGPKQSGEIKVKGRLIGAENELGIISGYITYIPENFSSEFRRDATLTTVVKDVGIDFNFDVASTALVGQEELINLTFDAKDKNFINNFRLTVEPQDNIEITGIKEDKSNKNLAKYTLIRPGVWQIDEVLTDKKELPIRFKILNKTTDKQDLVLDFEQVGGDNQYYRFMQKRISLDVMKNDLNVNLIINGSRGDQGVGLGDTLNYSIVYANRGETDMNDIVIMATLDSDYLNWDNLSDKNKGQRKQNTITWTKQEIPALATLGKNAEGSIDFSIKLLTPDKVAANGNYQVNSYAQFSIGNASSTNPEDNKSNVIVNKINSDLNLQESVRYFSEDNIPVGSGPNPPKVGEKTTYKTYWKIQNTIHELDQLEVRVKLPTYVNWDGKELASVGNVKFDQGTNEVIWSIGRLPASVHEATAEFSMGITPVTNDKNKILILLPGSKVSALDGETNSNINLTSKAQTTKLSGDDIGGGDGIVQ